MSNSRGETVAVVFTCGHKRYFQYGEHPKRNHFILCHDCNEGVTVEAVKRGKAA